MSVDLIVYLLLGGMLGRLLAMWAGERERRKREQDRKRLEAEMPPATSSFYPWNRQAGSVSRQSAKGCEGVKAKPSGVPPTKIKGDAGEMAAFLDSFSTLWAAAPDRREGARRKGAG